MKLLLENRIFIEIIYRAEPTIHFIKHLSRMQSTSIQQSLVVISI